jgi:hypothetical protein
MLTDVGVPVRRSHLRSRKLVLRCLAQVTLVLDSAAAFMMERVDMVRARWSTVRRHAAACSLRCTVQVLVGAEGVVESGGIINKLGTFQVSALLAMLASRGLTQQLPTDRDSCKGVRQGVLRRCRKLQIRAPFPADAARPAGGDEARGVCAGSPGGSRG